MLRDVPRIYLMLFGFIAVLMLLVFWYQENFSRDSDVLQLNEIILTNAVTEVDQTSRLYEGALLLSDTFEPKVWERLVDVYPACSTVQFEYKFDIDDERFDNVEEEMVQSPSYFIGGDNCVAESDLAPSEDGSGHMTGRPIQMVQVKIKEYNDIVGEWTYVSSVIVDSASRSE